MTSRADVVHIARAWVDAPTPYGHQQMMRGVLADCIGLLAGIGIDAGFASARLWARDRELRAYGTHPNEDLLLKALGKYLVRIPFASARLADIYLLRWPGGLPHFGLITDMGPPVRIAHAYYGARQACDTAITGFWRQGITWASLIDKTFAYSYREAAD